MPELQVVTLIQAPVERCFDLARDVEVHSRTAAFTRERGVARSGSTQLGLGDTVTFEGVHFGLRLRLTARIVEYRRPSLFVDEMVAGPFRSLRHVHEFATTPEGTLMTDSLTWTSPLGVLGRIADLAIRANFRRFLERRNQELQRLAEAERSSGR